MSEKLTEYITKPFDPIIAEELSIAVHRMCEGCAGDCRHDIGIELAQIVAEIQEGDRDELAD